MAMSGSMQAKLAPVAPNTSVEFNQIPVKKVDKAADMGEVSPDLDFRTMLQNSNAETARERSAKKSGDLSGAKTDEDFYRMLNERNNPSRTPKNQLGKDDFLKLFIAQMQNQDPTNPQDSSQMAAQMAQFNGLEQMMNVNTTLTSMLKAQDQGRAAQMIDYVGKEVDVGTGMLKFDKNKLTKSTFNIDQPLGQAVLEVRDGSGQVLSQEELGSLMPGEHNVKWAGRLKDGQVASPGLYNFQIVGKSVEGQDVSIPIKSKVKITGIDLKTDGGAFFTELGKIQMKDVTSVGIDGFADIKAAPAVNQLEAGAKDPKQGAKQQLDKQQDQAAGMTEAMNAVNPAEAAAMGPQGMPPGAGQLPPGLLEMAQKMVDKQDAAGPQGPEQEAGAVNPKGPAAKAAPANQAPAGPSGIPVTIAKAGE